MTRILTIAIAALFLTSMAVPAEAARHRRHRTMHHTMTHHVAKHGRTSMARSAPQRDGGDAAVEQLNQQSLNAARGAQ